jgi:hypothetical protein
LAVDLHLNRRYNRGFMDWYAMGSPRLGLEEGQARLDCPPGSVKVYLQEFPWEKCVPEDEVAAPVPAEVVEPPLPVEAPPPPAYRPPGKARFLEVDPTTGQLLDPETRAPLPVERALVLTPAVGTTIAAVAAVGIVAALLVVCGVFGRE